MQQIQSRYAEKAFVPHSVLATILFALTLGCGKTDLAKIDAAPEIRPANLTESDDSNWKAHAPLFGPRWPSESEGEWIDADDGRLKKLRLRDVEFVPMRPLPDEGYVPIESINPTVRALLENDTPLEIANIRVLVQAIAKADGEVLADETTETPAIYRSTLPKTTEQRKFVLREDGIFETTADWPPFNTQLTILAVRACNTSPTKNNATSR